ncbi:MAG: hypothetical protein MK096_07610 [Oleiphilaceae bacterium]|uniref:cytidylyltransferase domain-containing protein n=2 Tax=unclassified Oleiphilus TaxID=2631174 RepID=UPI0007C26FF2|nr:hypothetical protein [Oleiphilus sp. HI0125]KZZ58311.1 hypothetical protein A3762_08005 [Oleiphilus sp. HI0125]MCH2158624.1 hypothetical protein [Oleiphilaceae bacterium]
MKVVAFIPFWMGYHSQTGAPINRATKKLGGLPLINYSLNVLASSELIAESVIFSSSNEIEEYIEGPSYSIIKRPKFLDDNGISIEQIIEEFLKLSDADVFVLMHPNSPFIQLESIETCIQEVVEGRADSAFTAHTFKKFCWHKGRPLNYSLDLPTPQLKDIEPVILEQSSLYVFTRSIFEKERKRVGGKAYIHNVNHFEGHDLIEDEDFEIAELIVNSGMFSNLS